MAQFLEIDENDRKSLECPICKDLLNIPKVTRCSHIFCESCLTNYLEQSECNCPPCPVCRERIVLPQKGMQGFRTENFYQSLVTRLKEKDDLVKNIMTGLCGFCKQSSELISKCFTCACVICNRCLPSHNALKPHCTTVNLAEIDNVDVDELMSQRKVVCESHDTQLLDLYCHDCNKVICLVCKITDQGHSDHKCEPLNKRGEASRNNLKTLQVELTKIIKEAAVASHDVTSIFSDFLRDLQDATNKGNEMFDMFIAKLNKMKETFLKNIEEKRHEFNSRLRRQKEKVEKVKTDGQALLKMTKTAITYGIDVEIATLPNDLIQQIDQLKRVLHSSLHKDFRIKVHFDEGEYERLNLLLSKYNLNGMKYLQKVAVKSWKNTMVRQKLFPIAAKVGEDSLDMLCSIRKNAVQSREYLKIFYKDTFEQTSIECNKTRNINGNDKDQLIIEDKSKNLRLYDPLCVRKDKRIIDMDKKFIRLAYEETVIESDRSCVDGKVVDVDINHQDEILFIGQLSKGRDHFTILHSDGRFKSSFTRSKDSVHPPRGSFNNMGNVIVTFESLYCRNREMMLIKTEDLNQDLTANQVEKLILPLFPNDEILQPQAVYEKCDGLLYITMTNGSKILTISYLP